MGDGMPIRHTRSGGGPPPTKADSSTPLGRAFFTEGYPTSQLDHPRSDQTQNRRSRRWGLRDEGSSDMYYGFKGAPGILICLDLLLV